MLGQVEFARALIRRDCLGVTRGDSVEDDGLADRDARRGAHTAIGSFAHQVLEVTARCNALMMSAVEVAPGSWCPTDRSPRYEARPFRAWSGIVARMPVSAASAE